VADNLKAGRPVPGLALVIAGWMRYVSGVDEGGRVIDVKDPLAARLRAASDSADTPGGKVAALLAVSEIFPPALAADDTFRAAVTQAYTGLCDKGARAMVKDLAR